MSHEQLYPFGQHWKKRECDTNGKDLWIKDAVKEIHGHAETLLREAGELTKKELKDKNGTVLSEIYFRRTPGVFIDVVQRGKVTHDALVTLGDRIIFDPDMSAYTHLDAFEILTWGIETQTTPQGVHYIPYEPIFMFNEQTLLGKDHHHVLPQDITSVKVILRNMQAKLMR